MEISHQRTFTRLAQGIGANIFGNAVQLVIQFGTVTVLLHFWGVSLFGEWIILMAIPQYFMMSDFGFGKTAGNEMTISVARNDRNTAIEAFQSVWILMTVISISIILLMLLFIRFIPIRDWFNFSVMSSTEIKLCVMILTAYVLLDVQTSLFSAGFRCDGNYAYGRVLYNLYFLSDFAVMCLAVWLGAGPVGAATARLISKPVGMAVIRQLLRRKSPWIVYGYRHARMGTIRRFVRPSFSFMAFPLGDALKNQGIVLIISSALTPAAVVVYTTIRMLTSSVQQIMTVIHSSVWPELSAAYGAGRLDVTRKLHRYSSQLSIWLSMTAILALAILGRSIIHVWTQGKVPFDGSLFTLFLAIMTVKSLWFPSSAVLAATSHHQRMALLYISTNAAALGLTWMLLPLMGFDGAALSLLIVDIVMTLHVLEGAMMISRDRFSDFAGAVMRPPSYMFKLRHLARGVKPPMMKLGKEHSEIT